jgi:hypothetical protein
LSFKINLIDGEYLRAERRDHETIDYGKQRESAGLVETGGLEG